VLFIYLALHHVVIPYMVKVPNPPVLELSRRGLFDNDRPKTTWSPRSRPSVGLKKLVVVLTIAKSNQAQL